MSTFVSFASDFIPIVLLVARQTPLIGKVFYLPGMKQASDCVYGIVYIVK